VEQPVDSTLYDMAIASLQPYFWNRGKTNYPLPITKLSPPDESWGARGKDPEFIKVSFIFI
jgi:hypothetical protein